MQRPLAVALAAGALAWSVALLLAPLALQSPHPALSGAAAVLYQAAGLICHQRPERSFHLSTVQLPVCARCAGLYFSAALGALAAWLARPGSARSEFRVLLALAAAPTAVTVALEFVGLAYPSNIVRALCAIPLGAAGAWVFISMLRSERRTADRGERTAAVKDAL